MFLLYDLLIALSVVVLVPYYLLRRLLGGKQRRGLRERLTLYPAHRFAALAERPVIWVHAVSVGETRAAIPLLKALKEAFPDHRLLLSNVTETGRAIAAGISEVDEQIFFPVDHSWAMRRALRAIRPQLVVIVETEIWPNFVRCAAASGCPVALVNGRISDRSFPRYFKFRRLLAPVLARIDLFCMQSAQDAERMVALGAPPARVTLTGNLKFDMASALLPEDTVEVLRRYYRLPERLPVWVAGSTHAGEETEVLQVYRRLLDAGHSLLLILVPRHPERTPAIAEQLRLSGFASVRRSLLTPERPLLTSGEVLLVDTLGEMLRLYAAADLVFVGGSLVATGGHNILEAALVRRPVLFGPHMQNFREIAALVEQRGGGRMVADGDELFAAVAGLLDQPELAHQQGEKGHALIGTHAGATQRTVAALRSLGC